VATFRAECGGRSRGSCCVGEGDGSGAANHVADRHRHHFSAVADLVQIRPVMPFPGVQLPDIVIDNAFAQFLITRREMPPSSVSIPIAAFAAGAAISAVFLSDQ